MAKKYDWEKLKRKYVTSDYLSLRVFSEKENVPYGLLRQNAVGWNKERRALSEQCSNKIINKIIETQAEKIANYNAKHLDMWDKLSTLLDDELSGKLEEWCGLDNKHKAVRSLADVIDKLQKGQRLALGMDKDNGNNNNEKKLEDIFSKMQEAFKSDE